jgi:hypothetical protein
MAIRGSFRVALNPILAWGDQPWLHKIRQSLVVQAEIRAIAFGVKISRLINSDDREAFAMYSGHFTQLSETVATTAHALFTTPLGSAKWQSEIYDLSWLQSFAASHRRLHGHYAIRLLQRWAKARKPKSNLLSKCRVILALAIDGATLARSVEPALQNEFLQIVTVAANALLKAAPKTADEATLKAISLLYFAAAFRGFESLQKPATDLLNTSIAKIVRADGGHTSREPAAIVELLSLLLPLQRAMKEANQSFPTDANNALQRMMGMLAMLRHGNSELAFFSNTELKSGLITEILKSNTSNITPLQLAPYSDFARLTKGRSCMIATTQSSFGFEFSESRNLVCRCYTNDNAPHTSQTSITEVNAGVILCQEQTAKRIRTYYLSANGSDLRVEDVHESNLEIVFELGAEIKLTALRESVDLLLVLPDRNAWKLSVRGAKASIEQNGSVIRLQAIGRGRVNWALKKHLKSTKLATRKPTQSLDLLS